MKSAHTADFIPKLGNKEADLMKLMSFDYNQVFSSDYQRAPSSTMTWLGVASMLAFALVFWLSRDLGRICEVTAVFVLVLSAWQVWRQDRSEWLWLLMAGWLIFMAGVNFNAMLNYPQFDGDHIRYSRYYLRLFLFLVAGWWLGGNLKTVYIFLGLAALGLFIEVLVQCGTKQWGDQLDDTGRVEFAFRNAQHTAVLFSVTLIGLLCFWKRFFRIKPCGLQFGALLLWLALFVFSFMIIAGTQTRQVFPAFFLCMCTTGVWAMRKTRTLHLQFGRFLLCCTLAGIVVLAVALTANPFQGLQQRFAGEWDTISQVMQGDFRDISPYQSAGQRIYLWQLAGQKILESPFTGHGAATRYKLIQDSDIPEHIKEHYHHFHNGYLEMGVAFGLPGLFMLPLLLTVFGIRLIRARQKNMVPEDFMLFGLLSLIFFATVNLFESYVMYRSGYFFMGIIGGAIYTLTRPWTWKCQGEAINE
ncbi:MAG: O-antigen ligase family protein [Desulfovermiculus sp.]|nr:O-antigen ligase family protein [Desulfovermiculus sp.]